MSATKRKAKHDERRGAKRSVVVRQPEGKLRLYVADRWFDVIEVRDASPFGACVQIEAVIAEDAPVRMTYTAEGTMVEVSGTVIWRRAAKLDTKNEKSFRPYWVGIFLHPGDMSANLQFYRILVGLL